LEEGIHEGPLQMTVEMIVFAVVTLFSFITMMVALYNHFTAPIPGKNLHEDLPGGQQPLVSILIPARNEEKNIANCVTACLAQNHTNVEVLVLDDNSEDRTRQIVNTLSKSNQRVKLLAGAPLPEGWLGKNWACHQLSGQAKGEYLLFVDADVVMKPQAVGIALSAMKEHRLSMFSIFPTQILSGPGAALVIPIMNWLLLNFLPLKQVYKGESPSLVAANGQFIMFEREAYKKNGGHLAVKNKVVEDMELARSVKRRGDKLMTALGGEVVECRMYPDLASSIKGFTKNFYPGFAMPALLFFVMITFFILVYLLPFILIFLNTLWLIPAIFVIFSKIFISLLSRSFLSVEIFAHPVQMIIMYITGMRSIYFSKSGKLEWKGRTL